eukprot:8424339-Lingulodinium_polyedra.AAC.1
MSAKHNTVAVNVRAERPSHRGVFASMVAPQLRSPRPPRPRRPAPWFELLFAKASGAGAAGFPPAFH